MFLFSNATWLIIGIVALSFLGFVMSLVSYFDPKYKTCQSNSIDIQNNQLDRMPSFTLDVDPSISSKVISMSPITGTPVAGVKNVPYLSWVSGQTRDVWIMPVGTSGRAMVRQHLGAYMASRLWSQEGDSEVYYNTGNTLFISNAGVGLQPYGEDGILVTSMYTFETNRQRLELWKVVGDILVVDSVLTSWYWSGTFSVGISSTEENVRTFSNLLKIGSTKYVLAEGLILDGPVYETRLICFDIQNAAVQVTSAVLTLPYGSVRSVLLPSYESIDGEFYYLAETDTDWIRRKLTWDGTTSAPVVVTAYPDISRTPFVTDGLHRQVTYDMRLQTIMTSSGKALITAGRGITADESTSIFLAVDFRSDTVTKLEDLENTLGFSELRLLAHDSPTDTFLISSCKDDDVFQLSFCRFDGTSNQIIFLDTVKRGFTSPVINATIVSRSEQITKYILTLENGQVMPLWVNLTRGVLSFDPVRGIRPLGYIDETGSVYTNNTVISISPALSAQLVTGSQVFCDDDGNLVADGRMGKYFLIGTYLGNDEILFKYRSEF